MKKNNKDALRGLNKLEKSVAKILAEKWDPIGVSRESPREYDSYVHSVCSLLLSDAGQEQVCDYLRRVVEDEMGLSPDKERDVATAQQLLKLVTAS